MKIKKTITYFLGLLLCLLIASCCWFNNAVALADLLIKSFNAPDQISVGQTFEAITNVMNSEDDEECETKSSEATDYLIQILQQIDSNNYDINDWEIIYSNQDASVPELQSGKLAELLHGLRINQPGNYAYAGKVDAIGKVPERNENNNGYSGYGRTAKDFNIDDNNTIIKKITVSASEDSILNVQLSNKPIVEFISYKITLK